MALLQVAAQVAGKGRVDHGAGQLIPEWFCVQLWEILEGSSLSWLWTRVL